MLRKILLRLFYFVLASTIVFPVDALAADNNTTVIPPALVENLSENNISISKQSLNYEIGNEDKATVHTDVSFSLTNLESEVVNSSVAIPLKASLNDVQKMSINAFADGEEAEISITYADMYNDIENVPLSFGMDDIIATHTYSISSDSEMYMRLELTYDPAFSSVITSGIDDIVYLPNNKYRLGIKCHGEETFSISFIGSEPTIKSVGYTDSKMQEQTQDYKRTQSTEFCKISQWLEQYSKSTKHFDPEQELIYLAKELDVLLSSDVRRYITVENVNEILDKESLFYIIIKPDLLPKKTHDISVSYTTDLKPYNVKGTTIDQLFIVNYTFSENTLWHSDSQLNINVNTDMHIMSSSIYLKQSEYGGYTSNMDLRQCFDKSFEIILSHTERPITRSTKIISPIMDVLYFTVPLLFAITAGLTLIAFIIGRLKKHTKQ